MANLLLRLTWQDKAIKKARHSPFRSKEKPKAIQLLCIPNQRLETH